MNFCLDGVVLEIEQYFSKRSKVHTAIFVQLKNYKNPSSFQPTNKLDNYNLWSNFIAKN